MPSPPFPLITTYAIGARLLRWEQEVRKCHLPTRRELCGCGFGGITARGAVDLRSPRPRLLADGLTMRYARPRVSEELPAVMSLPWSRECVEIGDTRQDATRRRVGTCGLDDNERAPRVGTSGRGRTNGTSVERYKSSNTCAICCGSDSKRRRANAARRRCPTSEEGSRPRASARRPPTRAWPPRA